MVGRVCIALLAALLALDACPAFPQAVNLTGQARMKLPVISGVRSTNPNLIVPAPSIGQPVAVNSSTVDITLIAGTTGGTAPYTFVLERSATSDSSGFAVVASSTTLFDADGVFRDTGLTASTVYWYRLLETDSSTPVRTTAYSIVRSVTTPAAVGGDVTAPTVPTNLSCTSTVSGQADCSWTASTDAVGVTKYDVLRGDGDGAGNAVGSGTIVSLLTGAPPATTYLDTGLPPTTQKYYRLRAGDAVNNLSAYTARFFVTISGASLGTVLAGDDWENRAAGAQFDDGVTLYSMALGGTLRGSVDQGATLFPTIVGTPVNQGTRALQFFIPGNTTGGNINAFRSEVQFGDVGFEGTANYQNQEACIGFALRLDPSFPLGDGPITTVLIQQHTHTGQPGTSPLWGLRVKNQNQYWITTEVLSSGNPSFDLGRTINADRGVWRRWVFHVKYNDAGLGWIKTYGGAVTGALALLHDTGNFTTVPPGTTKLGNYKIGLYASGAKTNNASDRRSTVDSLRIGQTGCTTATVDPVNYP